MFEFVRMCNTPRSHFDCLAVTVLDNVPAECNVATPQTKRRLVGRVVAFKQISTCSACVSAVFAQDVVAAGFYINDYLSGERTVKVSRIEPAGHEPHISIPPNHCTVTQRRRRSPACRDSGYRREQLCRRPKAQRRSRTGPDYRRRQGRV